MTPEAREKLIENLPLVFDVQESIKRLKERNYAKNDSKATADVKAYMESNGIVFTGES